MRSGLFLFTYLIHTAVGSELFAAGKFFRLFCDLLIFSKSFFFEKFIPEYHPYVKQIGLIFCLA